MSKRIKELEFCEDEIGSWSYACESCTKKLQLPEEQLDREVETGTGTLCMAIGCYNLANHCFEVKHESVS